MQNNIFTAMDNAQQNNSSKIVFGTVDGQEVYLYTLTNKHGNVVKITNYGGIITEWSSKDKNGRLSSIIVGFNSLDKYIPNHPNFGALIGRFANRIAKGKFTLDGQQYSLACNNGHNHLHGGIKGFSKAIWNAAIENEPSPSLLLTYVSKDREEGYPGNLSVSVRFSFTDLDELELSYEAHTDKPTVVNLTSHPYFNLTGDVNNNILDHVVMINADKYTPVDNESIPTGEIAPVAGTPYNFTQPQGVGAHINETTDGYDHNYVLNQQGTPAAIVTEQTSGRKLEVFTDQPGIQFYTGNSLDGTMYTDDGKKIERQSALCLETQHYPDSPNQPSFPSTILRPGELFKSYTVYKLSVA